MKRLMSVVAFTGLLLDGAFAQSTVPSIPATLTVKNVKLAGGLSPTRVGSVTATRNQDAARLVRIVIMKDQARTLLKNSSGSSYPASQASTESVNYPSKAKVGMAIAGNAKNIIRAVGNTMAFSDADFKNGFEVDLDQLCDEPVESVHIAKVGDKGFIFVAKNNGRGVDARFCVGATMTDHPYKEWSIYRVNALVDNFSTCPPGGCGLSYIRYGLTANAINMNTNVEDDGGVVKGTLLTALPLNGLFDGDAYIDSQSIPLNESTHFAQNLTGGIQANVGENPNPLALNDGFEPMFELNPGPSSVMTYWRLNSDDIDTGLIYAEGLRFPVAEISETVDVAQSEGGSLPLIKSAGVNFSNVVSWMPTATGVAVVATTPYGAGANLNNARIYKVVLDKRFIPTEYNEGDLKASDGSALFKPAALFGLAGDIELTMGVANSSKNSPARYFSFAYAKVPSMLVRGVRNTPLYLLKKGTVSMSSRREVVDLVAYMTIGSSSSGGLLAGAEVADPLWVKDRYDDLTTTGYFCKMAPSSLR